MSDLLNNVRQLLALDADAGIEFYLRGEPAAPAKTEPAKTELPKTEPAARTTENVARVKIPEIIATPANPPSDTSSLSSIAHTTSACKACRLCDGRRNTVPGEGNPAPTLLFVGEGPGADEDEQGRPFVGAAGQLLTKMIEAMGLKREDVFIANVVKCRPPGNRTPEADEVNACLPFLEQQIALLKPKIICALGNTPLRALTGDDKAGITRMRGQKLSYRGITMIPTFHPSYLLRNPEAKKPCWDDLKLVLAEMGREPPKR
jgi:uracil-DNA glycosylase